MKFRFLREVIRTVEGRLRADHQIGNAGSGSWGTMVRWIDRVVRWEGFDEDERNYKLKIATNLAEAREALRSSNPEWVALLKNAFGHPNNLTYHISHARLLDWVEANRESAASALMGLWREDLAIEARLENFFSALPSDVVSGRGTRVNIASFLLMASDPKSHATYKASVYQQAFSLTDYEKPASSGSEIDLYLHAMAFLDRLIVEAAERNVVLRDRLDAQSVIWAILKSNSFEAVLSPAERNELLLFRGDTKPTWWVCQGESYRLERDGGYVWAPQRTKDGKRLAQHRNVINLRPGDVVIHYSEGAVRAIGQVESAGGPAPRPEKLAEGEPTRAGYLAKVRYFELDTPIPLEEIPVEQRIEHGTPFTKQGSVAQTYLNALNSDFAEQLRRSFSARWPSGSPWGQKGGRVWIFQANPQVWDLAKWLEESAVGAEETWSAAHHRKEMQAGDTVVLWMSGPNAGVYALSEITGPPREEPQPAFRHRESSSNETEWRVPIRLTRVLDEPILRTSLKEHPVLKNLAVIRAPQGTNYKVTAEEWEALAAMMGELPTQRNLDALVQRFKKETGYPREKDKKFQQERAELRKVLMPDALADPRAESFRRLGGPAGGSPGPQSSFMALLQDEDGVEKVAEAARHLLYGDGPLDKRFNDVMTGELAQKGMKEAVLTKMLSVAYPAEWVPAYVSKGQYGKRKMLRTLGVPEPPRTSSPGAEAVATNRSLRDPLRPYFGEDCWGMLAFAWWAINPEQQDEADSPRESMEDLARRLFLPVEFIKDIERLLEHKGQVIFYGPPGTGKTYVARELASFFATGPDAVRKVQFHPSYAYEDFVEGYRPRIADGEGGFQLVDGPLKQIAKQAQTTPGRHVLIIDEINRGNVAKVLGELYYLLEYRDEVISLQYSDEPFSLPEDLWVIGTMNTADRSIALVDAALRRRFHFVPFFPDEPPIKDLLREWLHSHLPQMKWVADLVEKANQELGDRHMAIGPSHFMRKDLNEEWVSIIWKHSIMPYIEEQHFGESREELKNFELERLRASDTPEAGDGSVEKSTDEADPHGE